MSVSQEQVEFVREALRDELGLTSSELWPGAEITITGEVLDRLARVAVSSTLGFLITAAQDGKTGEVLEVNADDPLRGE